MIILKIKNNVGPGNQMFMFARAYSLAKKYNHKILIVSEISAFSIRQNVLQYFMLDKNLVIGIIRLDFIKSQYIYRIFRKLIFDIILKMPLFIQIINDASRSRIVENEPILKNKSFYVIDGYFECHQYFDEYRNDLIKQLQPNYKLDKEVLEMIDEIENSNSIAVHIRKGDFKQFGRLIDDIFYEESISFIKSKYKNPHFYILTEDSDVKSKYRDIKNTTLINFNSKHKYIDEWYVLSKCKHHIIANSTYSWWASYLGTFENKEIIIPKIEWYLKAEPNNDENMYKNYYLESDNGKEYSIGFVILHYLVLEDTIECINSIINQIDTDNYEIVVVDNASPNKTGKYLFEKYDKNEKVTVILNNKNLGFSKGNNIGITYLLKKKYDFITVLNNDTLLLQNNFFEVIKNEYLYSQFAVLGPKVYDPSGYNNSNPLDDEKLLTSLQYRLKYKMYKKMLIQKFFRLTKKIFSNKL